LFEESFLNCAEVGEGNEKAGEIWRNRENFERWQREFPPYGETSGSWSNFDGFVLAVIPVSSLSAAW